MEIFTSTENIKGDNLFQHRNHYLLGGTENTGVSDKHVISFTMKIWCSPMKEIAPLPIF